MQPDTSPSTPGHTNLADTITVRVARCETVPQVLAASLEAFEFIRLLARQSQDRDPRLFAAFMTTAAAAADGLDVIASASSVPVPERAEPTVTGSHQPADDDLGRVSDALAALAAALARQLTRAAALASAADDRQACRFAWQAADEICHLMARADDDSGSR